MRKLGQDSAPFLAILSGILSALAFPPFRLAPLVFVAPVPLLWGLARARGAGLRSSFVLGWWAAFLHFLIVLHWILALPSEEVTIPGLMIPSLIFMSAYLALYFGAAAAVAVWISRRLAVPLGLIWPVFVTLADVGRSIGELAFPWASPAYALSRDPAVLQFSTATGFWGLSLWVALCGGLLYESLTGARRLRLPTGIALALLLLAPRVHGMLALSSREARPDDGAGVHVVMLQPNTSRTIKWDPRYREIVVEDLLERTRRAAERRPDLIVWPETAAPIVLLQEPEYLTRVVETIRTVGTPVLLGTLDHRLEAGSYVAHNSAALFDSGGNLVDRYDKQRLVPFSERMPFQGVSPLLAGLNFGQSDFTPGDRYVLFPLGGARIACLICFESIFPDLARRFADEGANLLLNITNDFWFGDNAAPIQHAEMAIFRAVETRRPLLRCANTGVSMVVDPWGRVIEETDTFVEATVDRRVALGSGATFYVRHGEWLCRALAALAMALVICRIIVGRAHWTPTRFNTGST
ncbi:MAG: apolipoprotein N-acyltransferase [Candidatus Eisenbacteria bacterium]|nr:apolipoprotein N-acyltransferase [Candidatus Eisenbacteria bacterium]